MGIQGVRRGHWGLKGVTGGYKGLQGITRGYRGVTRDAGIDEGLKRIKETFF